MKKTVLAYRNNELWQALQETIVKLATMVAKKNDSELVVKIFEPGSGPETIDPEIQALAWGNEGEVVQYILDGTLADRFRSWDVKLKKWDNFHPLNAYLEIPKELSVTTEQLYTTCFARLVTDVRPDTWVIVLNSLTDYDPLGWKKTEEDSYPSFTEEEVAAYAEKFKTFIPEGQEVKMCSKYDYLEVRDSLKGQKVIVVCHHHAAFQFQFEDPLLGTKDGSLFLESFPSGFLGPLAEVIRTDDLIGGDVLEVMRQGIGRREYGNWQKKEVEVK